MNYIHSFIHYSFMTCAPVRCKYSAPSRLLLRSAPDPCTAKEKSFEARVKWKLLGCIYVGKRVRRQSTALHTLCCLFSHFRVLCLLMKEIYNGEWKAPTLFTNVPCPGHGKEGQKHENKGKTMCEFLTWVRILNMCACRMQIKATCLRT